VEDIAVAAIVVSVVTLILAYFALGGAVSKKQLVHEHPAHEHLHEHPHNHADISVRITAFNERQTSLETKIDDRFMEIEKEQREHIVIWHKKD